MGSIVAPLILTSGIEKGSHKIGSASISTVAHEKSIDNSISKLLCDRTVLKNANIMRRARPSHHDVRDKHLTITDSLHVYRIVLFPVYESHSMLPIWANYSYMAAINGSNYPWKSRNVIELSLHLVYVAWEGNEFWFAFRNLPRNFVDDCAGSAHRNTEKIPNDPFITSRRIKPQGHKYLLHWREWQSSSCVMLEVVS